MKSVTFSLYFMEGDMGTTMYREIGAQATEGKYKCGTNSKKKHRRDKGNWG